MVVLSSLLMQLEPNCYSGVISGEIPESHQSDSQSKAYALLWTDFASFMVHGQLILPSIAVDLILISRPWLIFSPNLIVASTR